VVIDYREARDAIAAQKLLARAGIVAVYIPTRWFGCPTTRRRRCGSPSACRCRRPTMCGRPRCWRSTTFGRAAPWVRLTGRAAQPTDTRNSGRCFEAANRASLRPWHRASLATGGIRPHRGQGAKRDQFLADRRRAGYPHPVLAVAFSSSLCDRLMLRQPSFCHHTPRGEGCSSTAIGRIQGAGWMVWDNLTVRGSIQPAPWMRPAVP